MILYWGKFIISDGCFVEVNESSSWFNIVGNVVILIIFLWVIVVFMVFDECLEKVKSIIELVFCFFLLFYE